MRIRKFDVFKNMFKKIIHKPIIKTGYALKLKNLGSVVLQLNKVVTGVFG